MEDGDPEDWPSRPAALRLLDRNLRCPICMDIITGPVALACGHCFCSRCIRDALRVRSVCPSCRSACDAADLRPVLQLREAASAWKAVRPLLLQHHLQAEQQQQQQQQPLPEASHQPAMVLPPAPQPLPPQQQPGARSSGEHEDWQVLQDQQEQQQQEQQQQLQQPQQLAAPAQEQQQTATAGGGWAGQGRKSSSNSSNAAPGVQAAASSSCGPDSSAEQQQQQQQECGSQQISVSSAVDDDAGDSDFSPGSVECVGASPDWGPGAAADDDEADLVLQPAKRHKAGGQRAAAGPDQQQQQQAHGKHTAAPWQRPGQAAPDGDYVACPICSLSLRPAFIHSHLDTCLARSQQQQQAAATPAPAPASAAAASRAAPAAAAAAAAGSTGGGRSGGSSKVGGRSGGSKGGKAAPGAGAGAGAGGVVLEAPSKLCFELLKDKALRTKLTDLGLSGDGDKQACVQRYTAFRNYVLALKDSNSRMTLAQAAAAFTKQQRSIARAAAKPLALEGTLGAAVPAPGSDLLPAGMDCSFAALIKQTAARVERERAARQQQ